MEALDVHAARVRLRDHFVRAMEDSIDDADTPHIRSAMEAVQAMFDEIDRCHTERDRLRAELDAALSLLREIYDEDAIEVSHAPIWDRVCGWAETEGWDQ